MTVKIIDGLVDSLPVLQRPDVVDEVMGVLGGGIVIIGLRDDGRALLWRVAGPVMAHGPVIAVFMEYDRALRAEPADQGIGERGLAGAGAAGHGDKEGGAGHAPGFNPKRAG